MYCRQRFFVWLTLLTLLLRELLLRILLVRHAALGSEGENKKNGVYNCLKAGVYVSLLEVSRLARQDL